MTTIKPLPSKTTSLLVVDVDVRAGGPKSYDELKDKNDFPETLANKTGSGGDHIIYALPDLPEDLYVPNSESDIAPGIDIKSWHGFILLPGSTFNGKSYRWGGSSTITEAPRWLVERCTKPRIKPSASAGKRLVAEDDWARDAAWEAVKNSPVVHQGERNNACLVLANAMFDFGAELETAFEYAAEWNSHMCLPPMDLDEVRDAVTSAMRYRKRAIGYMHPDASGFDVADISKSEAERASRQKAKRDGVDINKSDARASALPTFAPVAPFDPLKLPRRPWVIPNLACRNVVSLVAGPGGVAKSTWTLQVAVAAVTGRSDMCGFAVPKRERVLVWNQEDDMQEMHRRLAAIMQAFNVSWDDLKDENGEMMLFLGSGVDIPLMLARRHGDVVGVGEAVATFTEAVRTDAIGLLILDPLVELHEVAENDNVEMRAVLGVVRRIAKATNCGAIVVTHVKKPDKAKSDGSAGDMDSARGASSQSGISRIGLTVYRAQESDKNKWGFEGSPMDYVRIDIGKNNLGPKSKVPIWFKLENTVIGGIGGESAAVLRPASPKKTDKTSASPDILVELARAISNNREACDGKNLSAIESHLPDDTLTALPAKNHRAEAIAKAFDGALEYPTDLGVLKRENRHGRTGWVYSVAPVPMLPQGNTGSSK